MCIRDSFLLMSYDNQMNRIITAVSKLPKSCDKISPPTIDPSMFPELDLSPVDDGEVGDIDILANPTDGPVNVSATEPRETSAECVAKIREGLAIGAAVGALTLPAFLLLIGLTPAGPVAGGWFAGSMGAGLTAGGPMATLQSMAMLGSIWKSIMFGAAFTTTGIGAGLMAALESKYCQD